MLEEVSRQAAERQNNIRRTADNTEELRDDIKDVIRNQNEYIELLRDQNKTLQIQLDTLYRIFVKDSEQVSIVDEIMHIMLEQDDENSEHPVRAFLADKSGDLGVAGITAMLGALRVYLKKRGVLIP